MKPILFAPDAADFSSLGIGVLAETTSCYVTEERNGAFELELQYPVDGKFFSSIVKRGIIRAAVDSAGRMQSFRIYKITKPMSGIVTVYAEHLSYDLSGVVLSPFSAVDAPAAMVGIKANSSTENPFTFITDKDTTANFKVSNPSTIRSVMGGSEGSLLDVFGGEYDYDDYIVKLLKQRGIDRGVTIRYGKNLIDLNQEENIQGAYTGVYPYWSSDTEYFELPEKVVHASVNYGFTKIKPLDASSDFEELPTEEALRDYAVSFMERNDIGTPSVSISVQFIPLEQSEEYKNIAPLQQVLLCDTVTVKFEKLGVDVSAKCVKTVFDVLKNRYKQIDLGNARTNITDTIAENKVSAITYAKKAVDGLGQMEIFNKLTDNGKLQGIYIQDNQWYINAELVKVINLIADAIVSTSGASEIRINGAVMRLLNNDEETLVINNSTEGHSSILLYGSSSELGSNSAQLSPHILRIGGDTDTYGVLLWGPDSEIVPWVNSTGAVDCKGVSCKISEAQEFRLKGNPFAVLNGTTRQLNVDYLEVSGVGNCEWIYDDALERYVLAQI